MRYALCVMRYALCVMRYALCVMRYALCVMRYAGIIASSNLFFHANFASLKLQNLKLKFKIKFCPASRA
ncbi:MAG: hypothetical protein IJQ63_02675 [Synergistaceae bacterium]|nr:hypothetical protein [Synergistaceae bacterium]